MALSNTVASPRWAREERTLLQAPICRQVFSGVPEVPFSYAELLLSYGFAHEETLAGLVGAWRGLLSLVHPSLMIASNAPVATMAARIDGIACVRIGTGFDCPPPVERTPLMRPWSAGLDRRLADSEALCLKTINGILGRCGASTASRVSEPLLSGETLLCTYPELDFFGPRAGRYFGILPVGRGAEPAGPGADAAVDVIAYVRLQYPHTEAFLAAVRDLGVRAVVHCPDASEAVRAKWHSDAVSVFTAPLDLEAWMPRCRVVASYAGHGLTASALLAGKPLLLLPNHIEQHTNARNVEAMGAALVAGPEDRHPKLKAMLKRLLDQPAFREAAEAFALRHAHKPAHEQLNDAIDLCERVAAE
jgi:hypothetical protein